MVFVDPSTDREAGMHVEIHTLFKAFLSAHEANPRESVVYSMAAAPKLGDFLNDLDPNLLLDWSGKSFRGYPPLREKVVARGGFQVGADDVLITAGTAEANFLAISQLVGPGDEMIVDVPGWPQPLVLGEAIGAKVVRLARREEEGWRIDLDELESLVSPRTRLIFLCNPNNPTGRVLTRAELTRVVRIAEKVGAYLLCDEVYAGLEWDGAALPRVADHYDRGISTGSVSKVLGLQGLRTGWMVSRDPKILFDAMVLREDTSEIMNVLGEYVADVALREDRYAQAVSRAQASGRANLDTIDAFISGRRELSWHRPQAGLIGFCRLDSPLDGDALSQALLEEPYRTFVMSGAAYGYPNHIRLGAGGAGSEGIAAGLEQLGAYLDKLGGTRS